MLTWDVVPQSLELGPDEIHLWRFDVDRNLGAFDDLERTLDPTELARTSRFRRPQERIRYVLGRGMLRTILACYLRASPAELSFRYNPLGKPELENAGLYFSLSHSGDLILYAFSSRDCVGVDAERVVPGVDQEISRHFLRRSMNRLEALPSEERRQTFYRAWTRMEAFSKTSGQGLEPDLRDLDEFIDPLPVREPRPYGTSSPDNLWTYDLRPREDYVAALVGPDHCTLKCWRWLAQN